MKCTVNSFLDETFGGRCCCNCRWQRPIAGHPWNKKVGLNGSVTTTVGYGCTVPDMTHIVFFDIEHSLCEMHEWKEHEEGQSTEG